MSPNYSLLHEYHMFACHISHCFTQLLASYHYIITWPLAFDLLTARVVTLTKSHLSYRYHRVACKFLQVTLISRFYIVVSHLLIIRWALDLHLQPSYGFITSHYHMGITWVSHDVSHKDHICNDHEKRILSSISQ